MTEHLKPRKDKEYLVTDSCFWEETPHEEYNPYDKKRAPHSIELVDVQTGSIVQLNSGSIIKIIKAR